MIIISTCSSLLSTIPPEIPSLSLTFSIFVVYLTIGFHDYILTFCIE